MLAVHSVDVEASFVPDDGAPRTLICWEAATPSAEIFFQGGSRKFHQDLFLR
jgi:hypothetical protein